MSVILVAEDNPLNQMLMEKILMKLGHEVTIAENGKEALNAFVNGCYDLIFMDIQMPVMDGFEATARIRDLEDRDHHIPIVALTAHALKGDREKCLQMGMDDYLSKPIEKKDVIKVIGAWTRPEAPQPAPAATVSDPESDMTLPPFASDIFFFQEMIESLRTNAPALLQRVADAMQSADAKQIQIAAHTVKGSLSNFGKNQATQTAAEIEHLARDGKLEHVNDAYRQLQQNVDQLIDYLSSALCRIATA